MIKAKSLHDETCDEKDQDLFVASNGWLQKFMRRNGLSLRRKTTTAQKDPTRLIDKLISYVLHVRRFSKMFKYESSCIIAMDETSVWDDYVWMKRVAKVNISDRHNAHYSVCEL